MAGSNKIDDYSTKKSKFYSYGEMSTPKKIQLLNLLHEEIDKSRDNKNNDYIAINRDVWCQVEQILQMLAYDRLVEVYAKSAFQALAGMVPDLNDLYKSVLEKINITNNMGNNHIAVDREHIVKVDRILRICLINDVLTEMVANKLL